MNRAARVSLWDHTSPEVDVGKPFKSDTRVDVAVVGGGYTGLSTALHCAEKGLSVQLLEAKHVGFGGSGRNVGLVNAGTWLPPVKLRRALGDVYGPRFIERFSEAPRVVFDLIEKHQIQCEATRSGTIHAAHSGAGFRDLRDRHTEWRRLGQPVDLLGSEDVASLVGSRSYVGGLLDHRAGTINPMAYCRGLARSAERAGAEISVGVKALRLLRDGKYWRIVTDQGDLVAANVVIGTNAYTDELWPGLNDGFTTIHYLQLATSPLGPAADYILPGRQGLWDTRPIMFNYRRDASKRLLIGTMGRVIGTKDVGLTRRWAAAQVARVFPDLGPVDFEEAWHGRIAMTSDHLPRIHRLDEGVWTAIGFNGRGITTGTVFGQAMADLLTGMRPAELPLQVSEPSRARFAGLRTRVYDMAFTANQVWRGLR